MMVKKRKQTFALIVPQFEDIFHSFYAGEILKGVGLAASRLKIDILVHITDRFDHQTWLDPMLLDHSYIDGIIFADIDNDVNLVKKVICFGMPCMVLNNSLTDPLNCIAIDNKKAAFEVVESLIQLGHKRIATITGDLSTQAGELRFQGYKEAMARHKIKIPKSYVTCGDFLRTPARSAAQKFLKLKKRPTAIFAASDVMALEVVSAAKEFKIKVPSELSVIGFDDNPLGVRSSIKLSTVRQPLIEMGRLGVEHLNEVVHARAKLPVKLMLSTQFVNRESTATAEA